MSIALPIPCSDYRESQVHFERAQHIEHIAESNLNRKRLIYDGFCAKQNMQADPFVLSAPFVRYSMFQLLWRHNTTHLTPQQHYFMLHCYYWFGTNLHLYVPFCGEVDFPIEALTPYFHLNYPMLQQFADQITQYSKSARCKAVCLYYQSLGLFDYKRHQFSAPILSNFACLAKPVGGCLIQYNGLLDDVIMLQGVGVEGQSGVLHISSQERMILNVLKGPFASTERIIEEVCDPSSSLFVPQRFEAQPPAFELRDHPFFIYAREVVDDIEREVLAILGERKRDTKQALRKGLTQLTDRAKPPQQETLLTEMLMLTQDNQTYSEMIKRLWVVVGKPTMAQWADKAFDRLDDSEEINELVSVFRDSKIIHQDQIDFARGDTVFLTDDDQFGVPQIQDMGLLQRALEALFKNAAEGSLTH